MPIQNAEGAVSWNGFLKQVGFNPPTVYEVSADGILLQGEMTTVVQIVCLDDDWLNQIDSVSGYTIEGDAPLPFPLSITGLASEVFEDSTSRFHPRKVIGLLVTAVISGGGPNPVAPSNIPFTVTILCLSPSSLMTVGGEWQATDTTALIIGYSVLNAYWIAPIGIGIGVGVYLTRNRWQRR